MKRRLLTSVCLMALTFSYRAELLAQAAPSNPTKVAEITTNRLIVNGHAVQSIVVRIDNRLYVSLEDLSSALNGAVTLKGDDVIASFNTEPASGAAAQNSSGGIRGTLTYFFNTNSGNRPDTGAEVALVPGRLDVSTAANVIMLGSQITVGTKKVEAVKTTTADGSGNYSMQDVAPGEYTLLLKSNHANGATQRDIGGKIRTEFLTIESGKTLDISLDFGLTAF